MIEYKNITAVNFRELINIINEYSDTGWKLHSFITDSGSSIFYAILEKETIYNTVLMNLVKEKLKE